MSSLRWITALLFLWLPMNRSMAQTMTLDESEILKKYTFLNLEQNKWNISSDSSGFMEFRRKYFNSVFLSKEQLNIVHFGGSHIQADMYTHVMRRFMQEYIPGGSGGAGLIFPFTSAGTNNPFNYKVYTSGNWIAYKNVFYERHHKNLGVNGMAIEPVDSVSGFSIALNQTGESFSFNKVRVYHKSAGPGCFLNVSFPKVTEQREVPDSGYTEFSFYGQYDSISFFTSAAAIRNGENLVYGILPFSGDTGVVYHSIGVNGASLVSYNNCSLFEPQLNSLKPDLVIVSIGTNDANTTSFSEEKYKENFREFIKRIRDIDSTLPILLTVPNDCYYRNRYVNPNTALVEEAIRELAKEFHCGVWDFYEVMGGKGSIDYWLNCGLAARDRIHFTPDGYKIKGILFFSAFIGFLDGFEF